MPRVNLLSDVEVEALALVKRAANRQRWFLRKSGEPESVATRSLIAKADWSRVYVVVAEPGAEEDPGQGADDPTIPDIWASEEEIAKAQRSFVRNDQATNKMHTDLAPYGTVVENAIALADFTLIDHEGMPQMIRKGSWYVAIEPTSEGRRAIEAGELTGVSIEGDGTRKLIEKYDPAKRGMALPDLERVPGIQNWVDRVGGFPKSNWIYRAAKHMHYEKGMSIGRAIATAVNAAKKLCATGDLNFPGVQEAHPAGRADACKGVAEWERMKAQARVTKGAEEETEESVDAVLDALAGESSSDRATLGPMSLAMRIAKKIGLSEEEIDEALADDVYCDCGCEEFTIDTEDPDSTDIEKAKLTARARRQLPRSAFVFPEKAPGSGSYPIHDRSHAQNALARSSGKPEEGRVRAAVCRRYSDLPSCKQGVRKCEECGSVRPGDTVSGQMEREDVEKVVGEKLTEAFADEGDGTKAVASAVESALEPITKKLAESGGTDDGAGDDGGQGSGGDGSGDDGDQKRSDLEEKVDRLSKELGDALDAIDVLAEGDSAQSTGDDAGSGGNGNGNVKKSDVQSLAEEIL